MAGLHASVLGFSYSLMLQPGSIDPVDFASQLIRCPSVTPAEAGTLDLLQETLEQFGFSCTRYPFEDVDNLYARMGTDAPNFCYAGHTDVVPAGNESDWLVNPFAGKIEDGKLWGRGASDMKGGIGAFVAALSELLISGWNPDGSISLLITSDEEGPAINGTRRVLETITKAGEVIDHCLTGEPTNPETLGQMIKIGRRGSLNGVLTVSGQQGHVAYPDLATNPVPALLHLLDTLRSRELDQGNENFQPSNLEITSVDVDNHTHNVIAASAIARLNIRFNTEHDGENLVEWIKSEAVLVARQYDCKVDTDLSLPGLPFLTTPCHFTDMLVTAVNDVTGLTPVLSTSGGTSDARFISNYAPVVEFGLVGKTIHKVNEYSDVQDIYNLCDIYKELLIRYFTP